MVSSSIEQIDQVDKEIDTSGAPQTLGPTPSSIPAILLPVLYVVYVGEPF